TGYGSLEFIRNVGGEVHKVFEPSYRELFTISELYHKFLEDIFESKKVSRVGEIENALKAMKSIINLTAKQVFEGATDFERVAGAAYASIQTHHKDLRRKYQGLGEEKKEDADSIFAKLFGLDEGKKDANPKGPKTELVDGNSVLTDTLLDIINNLPRHYETVVPVGKDGRTKVVRKIDDYEVQNTANVLLHIANPTYLGYLREPNIFPEAIAESIQTFYTNYKDLEPNFRKILESVRDVKHVIGRVSSEVFDKRIPSPEPIVNRLKALNFLSIRPTREEIQPRTKMEKDYSSSRARLLYHLRDTLENLARIPNNEEKERTAVVAVRTAITLRDKMDEILDTERDRRLKRDIRGENEFYVGRTGNVGAFYSEREPAPRIRYKDVYGKSFDNAKEHVEEVIGIASFQQTIKVTAPRGKIKSNILLIGPYGCGKSEFARAIAGDRRVVGLYISVADVLTAYLHESVKNVKRVWEEGKRLRQESRYTKPVAIIQDEFDGWFQQGDFGFRHADEQQMERVLQEVLDGLVEYDGVFTVALTNRPGAIPDAILRRFKYVDIVGQLTLEERAHLFRHFLTRGMPISPAVKSTDYMRWAEMLEDAPGDVLGKIADEVHFKFIRGYKESNPRAARRLESYLQRIEHERDLSNAESGYTKRELAGYKRVGKQEIETAIIYMLKQPPIQKEIKFAGQVYSEAEKIVQGLMEVSDDSSIGFGAKEKSRTWSH
ncbi:MAG: ATP-binding protein, partial [Nanoarchaeota archaeon]